MKERGWQPFSVLEELVKLCTSEVSEEQARAALTRLKQLEATRPTAEQISRGAAAGAIVAPGVTFANKLVAGGMGKELGKAVRAPGVGGKVLGLGRAALGGGRQLAAASAGSAMFGSALPVVRSHLDRKAEEAKLRQYLGMANGGRFRRTASQYLGV